MTSHPTFRRIVISLALVFGLMAPAYATFAQTSSLTGAVVTKNCPILSNNLYVGLERSDVTQLQEFLTAQGYFHVSPIGIFGPLTFRAVQQFQAAHGIPNTGYVGVLTRAQINSMQWCNQPIPLPLPIPTPTTNAPTIQAEYPATGNVGTTVTLTGSNFFGNNMVFFGGGEFSGTAFNNGTMLTFTVPSSVGPYCPPGTACPMYLRLVTPGPYSLYIQNQNGTSNTVTFTVSGTPLQLQ